MGWFDDVFNANFGSVRTEVGKNAQSQRGNLVGFNGAPGQFQSQAASHQDQGIHPHLRRQRNCFPRRDSAKNDIGAGEAGKQISLLIRTETFRIGAVDGHLQAPRPSAGT